MRFLQTLKKHLKIINILDLSIVTKCIVALHLYECINTGIIIYYTAAIVQQKYSLKNFFEINMMQLWCI